MGSRRSRRKVPLEFSFGREDSVDSFFRGGKINENSDGRGWHMTYYFLPPRQHCLI